ncbi:uncharacterized protein LOC123451160 [Hordeum vulgare subsp. vulgare]|uniref:uncharacterized protein LOC123451160 n=1 Tax=Hordeum vulgare subsp. vulgare TaxID=112509 RepID=UPI00162DA4A2|nr:uncharacterized protein LOC123451160 [Hordeum vulgare subsp. vulgare]
MEHKGQLQPEKKSAQEEEEEAMAMAASSPSFFFAHPLSLLHGCTTPPAASPGTWASLACATPSRISSLAPPLHLSQPLVPSCMIKSTEQEALDMLQMMIARPSKCGREGCLRGLVVQEKDEEEHTTRLRLSLVCNCRLQHSACVLSGTLNLES